MILSRTQEKNISLKPLPLRDFVRDGIYILSLLLILMNGITKNLLITMILIQLN